MSGRNLLGQPERHFAFPDALETESGTHCNDPRGGAWLGRKAEQSPLTHDENSRVACRARRHQGNCLPFLLYTPTWGSKRWGYPCCGLCPSPRRQLSPIPTVHAPKGGSTRWDHQCCGLWPWGCRPQCGGSPAVVLREATIWSLTSPLHLRKLESFWCASRIAAGCWGVPLPSVFDMMVAVHHFWMNPVFSLAHAFLRQRHRCEGSPYILQKSWAMREHSSHVLMVLLSRGCCWGSLLRNVYGSGMFTVWGMCGFAQTFSVRFKHCFRGRVGRATRLRLYVSIHGLGLVQECNVLRVCEHYDCT